MVVLGERRGEQRVFRGPLHHRPGLDPAVLAIADQAHQAAGGGVLGIGEHGQGEVLEPLGAEAVLLAPEGQAHVSIGIATGLDAGGAVGGEIGGGWGIASTNGVRDGQ